MTSWVVCGGTLLLGSLSLFTWWCDSSEGLPWFLCTGVGFLAFCLNNK